MTGGPEVVGRMEESASSQPVAIVTGASRDIGRGIAEELSREGFAVIANHRDPQKDKRNTEIRGLIESTGGEWHIGDITTEEGRAGLVDIVERHGGKLDLLVLNAAGPSRELNVVANLALVDTFLPRMNKGGAIIFMQSTVGHFVDLIDPSQLTAAGYENVAPSKNEAEAEIRKKQSEADEHKVKIFFPTPPEVSDTTNIRLFNYRDPEASTKSAAFSRSLGLPEAVTIKDVGEKVAELIRRKDELPQGYTDFFNETIDARPALRTIYDGDNAVYVDTLEADGTVHTLVTEVRVEEGREKLVESAEGDLSHATSTVLVKDEHTRGHFGVLPGHKGIKLIEETMRAVFKPNNPGKTLQISSIESGKFGGMIVPGNTVETVVEQVSIDFRGATYNATVSVNGKVCYEILGVRFQEAELTDEDALRFNQLVETLPQAMGLAAGFLTSKTQGKDMLPLFNGFEGAFIYRRPRKGEALSIRSSLIDSGEENKIAGGSVAFIGDEVIASIRNIEASMLPATIVRGLIRRAQRSVDSQSTL